MIFSFRYCARVIVHVMLAGLTLGTARASGEQPKGKAPDQLPISRESVTGPTARQLGKPIRWQDREYDVATGIDVLMRVIREPENDKERELGLVTLAMASRDLEGHPCLDELGKLYAAANDLDKGSILICFQGSGDPRGIPVYDRTLENSQNLKLRLWAAGALAHWNIRRGVAELVKMLGSTEMLPPPAGMLPYVRDSALNLFRVKNIHKGWGFPDDEASALAPRDVDAGQKPPPSVAEIKKWFAENEHRFPDWKPGDPLPENEPTQLPKEKSE